MNIWIINHYAETPDQKYTRHYDLGREMVRKGHDVTIFASSFSHYEFREMHLQHKEKWKVKNYDSVRFILVRTPPYVKNDWRRAINMLTFAWRVFWVGKKSGIIPEVIISPSVHPLAAFSAYLLSKLKKCRFFLK